MIFKFIILAAVIISCASQQTSQSKTPLSYERIANAKFKDNIDYFFNSNKSYVLCVKQSKTTHKILYPPLAFFVYDLKNEKIVYEESFNNGSAKWVNDTQIKVTLVPGIISGIEKIDSKARGFIYDLAVNRKLYEKIEDRR